MNRTPGALLLLLAAAGCAGTARHTRLREQLDGVRIARTPEDVWPDVLKFLNDRGFGLVGKDRDLAHVDRRSGIVDALSLGHEAKVRKDGSRVSETDRNREGVRIRAEGLALGGGVCRVVLTELRADPVNEAHEEGTRDLQLELALLERLDPAQAAAIRGGKAPTAAPVAPADPWEPVRPLVGTWESEGGAAAPGGVRWAFAFTAGDQFLEVRGSSILGQPAAGGEELGRISRDLSRGRLVWRQFTSGGQVNQYVLDRAGEDALVFVTESAESLPAGSRARLTLGRAGPDEMLAVCEIAAPGKGFAVVAESRVHRVR